MLATHIAAQISLLIMLAMVSKPSSGAANEAASPCSANAIRAQNALDSAVRKNNTQLWGKSLAGPLVLVDTTMRTVERIAHGSAGPICESRYLSPDLPDSNTCLDVAGQRTAYLMPSLPIEEAESSATPLTDGALKSTSAATRRYVEPMRFT